MILEQLAQVPSANLALPTWPNRPSVPRGPMGKDESGGSPYLAAFL